MSRFRELEQQWRQSGGHKVEVDADLDFKIRGSEFVLTLLNLYCQTGKDKRFLHALEALEDYGVFGQRYPIQEELEKSPAKSGR